MLHVVSSAKWLLATMFGFVGHAVVYFSEPRSIGAVGAAVIAILSAMSVYLIFSIDGTDAALGRSLEHARRHAGIYDAPVITCAEDFNSLRPVDYAWGASSLHQLAAGEPQSIALAPIISDAGTGTALVLEVSPSMQGHLEADFTSFQRLNTYLTTIFEIVPLQADEIGDAIATDTRTFARPLAHLPLTGAATTWSQPNVEPIVMAFEGAPPLLSVSRDAAGQQTAFSFGDLGRFLVISGLPPRRDSILYDPAPSEHVPMRFLSLSTPAVTQAADPCTAVLLRGGEGIGQLLFVPTAKLWSMLVWIVGATLLAVALVGLQVCLHRRRADNEDDDAPIAAVSQPERPSGAVS